MLRGESIWLHAFQVQYPHQAIPPQQRNHQFGAHFYTRFAWQVARVQAHVNHTDGPALRRRASGDALMQGYAHAGGDGVLVAHGKYALEHLRGLVPKQDREYVVVHQLLGTLRDQPQEFAAVQDRRDFVTELVQEGECFRLSWLRHIGCRRRGIRSAEHRKGNKFGTLIHVWTLTATP